VRPWPVRQILHGHPAAHAPADQVHLREIERVDGGGQIVGVVPQATGGVDRFRVGVAEPAQVDGQGPVAFRQREHRWLPEQRG